ncbi:MAG: hypothetical protein U0931_28830 [Vulcanimicrobiota bacterium]
MSSVNAQSSPVFRRQGWTRFFKSVTADEAYQAFDKFGCDLAEGRYQPGQLQSELEGLREQRLKASARIAPAVAGMVSQCEHIIPQGLLDGVALMGLKMVDEGTLYLNYEEVNEAHYSGSGFCSSRNFKAPGQTLVAWTQTYQRPGATESDPALVYFDYRGPARQGLDPVGVPGGVEVSRINGWYFVPSRNELSLPGGKRIEDLGSVEDAVQAAVSSLERSSTIHVNHDTTGFGEVDTEHWFQTRIGGQEFSGEEAHEVAGAALHYGLTRAITGQPGSAPGAGTTSLQKLAQEREQPLLRLEREMDSGGRVPTYHTAVALELEEIEAQRQYRE